MRLLRQTSRPDRVSAHHRELLRFHKPIVERIQRLRAGNT
jgi:hypothetical protein